MSVELPETPAPDRSIDPDAQEICDFLRWFREHRADPLLWDSRRSFGPGVVSEFAAAGLLGLQIPQELGGRELSDRAMLRVMTELGATDCNLLIFTAVHNAVGVPPVLAHATEATRQRLLPRFAAGQALSTTAASEPGMGSNLRALDTTATKHSDGCYTINGRKKWISLGAAAGAVNVITRLVDEAGSDLGYAGFVVDARTPGFVAGAEEQTVGLRAVPQNALAFEDVRVGPESLLGVEGGGITVANSAFMLARLTLASGILGAAKRGLVLASGYAETREVATGTLISNGRTRVDLGDDVAAVAAVEALMEHIMRSFDLGEQPHDLLYFIAKIVATEELYSVIDHCMQLLGARGYMDPNLVGQDLRDYRLFRIFEGATQAITQYVGNRVRRTPGAFRELIDAIGVVPSEISTVIGETEQRIADMIDEANECISQRADDPRVHILHHGIGDLTCYAVLAATAGALPHADGEVQDHTENWVAMLLEQRLVKARRDTRVNVPSQKGLLAPIDRFKQDLGPLPNGPGEQHARDPLLP